MSHELTFRAAELLEDLPPYEQNSTDIRGAVQAIASEVELLEERMETVRRNFVPQNAVEYLHLFELLLRLPIAPMDKSEQQRRSSVMAFYSRLNRAGTGLEWQDVITDLIGEGWTYAEHDPDDPSSPDPYSVEMTIPFASPINLPTGVVGTPGGGGTLAADDYYYGVSAYTFYGETPFSGIEEVTVGASGSVALDWNDVADAEGYYVYRGTSPDILRRLDTAADITSSSYTDLGDALLVDAPTNTNTTGSWQSSEARRLAREITPANIELVFSYDEGFIVGISELGDFI